jgi:mannose-6-phosphate isomerase-like protein (cupin superfamily)
MGDGIIVRTGEGDKLDLGPLQVIFKIGEAQSKVASRFENVISPGADVGAHIHNSSEEVFYILEGTIEVLTFEPVDGRTGDWRTWKSAQGETVALIGPGSMVCIPPGCPHSFYNPGPGTARFLIAASPEHERYMHELADILSIARLNPELQADVNNQISKLRKKYDITPLTPFMMRK